MLRSRASATLTQSVCGRMSFFCRELVASDSLSILGDVSRSFWPIFGSGGTPRDAHSRVSGAPERKA
jgi:hypothetical protein